MIKFFFQIYDKFLILTINELKDLNNKIKNKYKKII